MFKSKLQVLCQQNSWDLPEYSTDRDGPDHNPRFLATVTVNSLRFDTIDRSRTAKEAQNKAAKLAFEHLSAPKPPLGALASSPCTTSSSGISSSIRPLDVKPSTEEILLPSRVETVSIPLVNKKQMEVKDDKVLIDAKHLYKTRLQTYAQKRNLTLPEYSCERDGPPHASRFKSKVKIDGKTYESLEFFSTIKEAEHAAAKVAWKALSLDEVQEEDSALYKNLLQEFAQKEGLDVPKYETTTSGPSHMPTFFSIVEIKGQTFQGQGAKSKKQAEMSAAKVAYTTLQERWKNKDERETACSESLPARMPGCKNKDEERTACSESLPVQKPGGVSLIPTFLPSGSQLKKSLKESSSILQSVIPSDLPQKTGLKSKLTSEAQEEECAVNADVGKFRANEEKIIPKLMTTENVEGGKHGAPAQPPEADFSSKRHRCSPPSDIAYAYLRDPFPPSSSPPDDDVSSFSTHTKCTANSNMGSNNEPPVVFDTTSQENVVVYPCEPNMTFPEGTTVLPFSDDKWVALKMHTSQ